MRRRWEVVATMTVRGLTLVVPISEGREFRWTRVGGRLAARRFTRNAAWGRRSHPLPEFVWIVRRRRS